MALWGTSRNSVTKLALSFILRTTYVQYNQFSATLPTRPITIDLQIR